LPSGPVVNDLLPRHGQGVIGINVVEVTEAEQDVVDRLLGILGFEAGDEQRQTLVGRPPGPLFDRHQVEVIAQSAAIPDHRERHGQKVAEPGDLQAVDFLRRFKEVLGAAFVGVQELHLGGGEDAVKGSRRAIGDGKRAYGIQAGGQLVEVDALMSPPCPAGVSRGPGQKASSAFLARLRASARCAGSSPRVAAACSHALAGRFRLPQARPSGSKDVMSRRAINGAELPTSSWAGATFQNRCSRCGGTLLACFLSYLPGSCTRAIVGASPSHLGEAKGTW
jgi:hypothetical protein